MATSNIFDLPFISKGKPHTDFWHVFPTGDYGRDCNTGSEYALEYLDYCRKTNNLCCLPSIVLDMPCGDNGTGIEVGFMHAISHEASFGRGSYLAWQTWADKETNLMAAREWRERSERAHKASRARWSKVARAAHDRQQHHPSQCRRRHPAGPGGPSCPSYGPRATGLGDGR